jgi:hypothetical protein
MNARHVFQCLHEIARKMIAQKNASDYIDFQRRLTPDKLPVGIVNIHFLQAESPYGIRFLCLYVQHAEQYAHCRKISDTHTACLPVDKYIDIDKKGSLLTSALQKPEVSNGRRSPHKTGTDETEKRFVPAYGSPDSAARRDDGKFRLFRFRKGEQRKLTHRTVVAVVVFVSVATDTNRIHTVHMDGLYNKRQHQYGY